MDEGVLDVESLSLSLYEEAPFGEPGGGLHYWGPWKMLYQGSGNGTLSSQGPCRGTWKEACITETLRDERRDQMGLLSPRDLIEGNLEGGLLFQGT